MHVHHFDVLYYYVGNATRYCDADGNWTVPVVIECRSPAFVNIQTLVIKN